MKEDYLKHNIGLIRLKQNSKQPMQSWSVAEPDGVIKRHAGNIGVLTGASNLIVVDVDTHGENPMEGYSSLVKLFANNKQQFPDTFEVTTPSNGTHYYFRLPADCKLKFNKQLPEYPSIDLQSGQTYVVGAGSTIDGKSYKVAAGSLDKIAEAPAWLLNTYRKQPRHYKSTIGLTYTGEFLEEIYNGAGEGSRNVWLTTMCGKLIRSGISFPIAHQWTYWINQIGCKPPLDKQEVEVIFKSIKRSEIRNRKLEEADV